MDNITLTFTIEEVDLLHFLLVLRRQSFNQFRHQFFHYSPALDSYTQELKVLEAKLMQLSLHEYNQVPESLIDD